jgi:hypothetical protein
MRIPTRSIWTDDRIEAEVRQRHHRPRRGSRARASRSVAPSPAWTFARARPLHPHGPDGRGRVRARRTEGHAVAPAPRVRDRHLHHRRHVAAPGLPRRRRVDRRRRHPVDDRRCAASSTSRRRPRPGRSGRPVPRHPAVGEPPGRREDGRARRTRTSRATTSRCSARPTVGRSSGSSPATSTATPARAAPNPDHDAPPDHRARCAQVRLPWPEHFNGLVYGLSGAGTVGPDQRPLATGQLAVTAPGDVLTLGGSPSPDARTDAFDVLVLGGQRIGEPVAWHGPFVMNTRAELMARPSRTTRPASSA